MSNQSIITGLDFQGRGVTRLNGKAVFVTGALPGECVHLQILQEKKRFAEAEAIEICQPAPMRVVPRCQHFSVCGGCDLQHADATWQTQAKQQLWLEQLERLGGVVPERVAPPLTADAWHYRSRARLSVSYLPDSIVVGFKARRTQRTVDIEQCLILDTRFDGIFTAIRQLLTALRPMQVSEVSLNAGDSVVAIGLQAKTWSTQASTIIHHWLQTQPKNWQVWRQDRHEKIAEQSIGGELTFSPQVDVHIPYMPADFTQINAEVNRQMVAQAIAWLNLQPKEQVWDLFCGLGNFTVPMARQGALVYAVEGVAKMVEQLHTTAHNMGLSERIRAVRCDLFAITAKQLQRWGRADAWLLDPPRAGAQQLLESLPSHCAPKRIVYVSCNPATLARDAHVLATKGYRLYRGGIINMFPQTRHIESMILFTKE